MHLVNGILEKKKDFKLARKKGVHIDIGCDTKLKAFVIAKVLLLCQLLCYCSAAQSGIWERRLALHFQINGEEVQLFKLNVEGEPLLDLKSKNIAAISESGQWELRINIYTLHKGSLCQVVLPDTIYYRHLKNRLKDTVEIRYRFNEQEFTNDLEPSPLDLVIINYQDASVRFSYNKLDDFYFYEQHTKERVFSVGLGDCFNGMKVWVYCNELCLFDGIKPDASGFWTREDGTLDYHFQYLQNGRHGTYEVFDKLLGTRKILLKQGLQSPILQLRVLVEDANGIKSEYRYTFSFLQQRITGINYCENKVLFINTIEEEPWVE